MSMLQTKKECSQKIPSSEQLPSIGNYLLDCLYDLGVEHIFGIPGDYVLPFDKLIELHRIQFINTTRENTAGYMADAYARLKGLGALCMTYGVGVNSTNAISQAFAESSPVVVISGSPGEIEFSHGQKLHHLLNKNSAIRQRDTTQLEIFKHITAAQVVLDDPSCAAQKIQQTLRIAIEQQKPVYIEIPRDTVLQPIASEALMPMPPCYIDDAALEELLEEVAHSLQQCQRPVIWAGHELLRYGLSDALCAVAEKYHIPIVSSLLGKTVISERHPLFMGLYQGGMSAPQVREFVENSDWLMQLGVVASDVETGIFTAKMDQPVRICANIEGISVNHHNYKDVGFVNFVQGLSLITLKRRFDQPFPAKAQPPATASIPKDHVKITSARIFEIMQAHLRSEHVIISDIGDCLFGCADLILEHNSFLACPYFATLGFATPAAVAVQLACPQRRAIAVVGDGAFQMTCMELSTAVRYGLDPIIIVLNNHGYATERPLLEGSYNDIQEWDYAAIPQVLQGGIGLKATTEGEFQTALMQALKQRGQFYLIEVDLDKLDFSPALKRFTAFVNQQRIKDNGNS